MFGYVRQGVGRERNGREGIPTRGWKRDFLYCTSKHRLTNVELLTFHLLVFLRSHVSNIDELLCASFGPHVTECDILNGLHRGCAELIDRYKIRE
jgi:hypothetical protein